MRVLTLSNVPLDERFGSAYVILGYVRGLRELGHQVDVFGPETLEGFKFLRRGKLLRTAWGMLWHVARHAANGQYDVVELYGGQTCFAARYLHRIKDREFLVVAHTNGIEMHMSEVMAENGTQEPQTVPAWVKRWTDLPMKLAFMEVDGIVTVSQFDLAYARQKGLQPGARLKSIGNPLAEEFLGTPFSLERSPLIGFVAPWLKMKGSELVSEALPLVLRRFYNARLRLIGVGRGFRKEDHFPEDVCDRIEVLNDGVKRDALKNHYQEMSVLMMPSAFESFGLVAAEAMACGSPVVAAKTGFPEGLTDEEDVLLMKGFDAPSLVEALTRILSDEALRQKIAANGWKRVQNLRWDRAVVELERTYMEWLETIRGMPSAGTLVKGTTC